MNASAGELESPDLNGFLEWLEAHSTSDSDCYRDLLERLVCFFAARNQADADECAALTLHIAAFRYRPADRDSYDHPRKFILGVARNVNYEMFRRARRFAALDERMEKAAPQPIDEETESELVQECVRAFGRDNVAAIIAYYENFRKGKAADSATRTRMCRLKGRMKIWLEQRLAGISRQV